MWIKNIYLDDFGCFDHAHARGFDDELNVIAGPQRAGKTTFMQAVRHLGYGFPRGGTFPPAADDYDVSTNLVVDGDEYEVSLEGHGEPSVAPLDGAPERTVAELFDGTPATQYQQLYTVSLDELRRKPTSLDDGIDLSTVLLSGAYGNIQDVPDVGDVLAGRAKSIGGKHGRASYKLGGPIRTIQDGMEARDEAIKQVDEYEKKSAERDAVFDRIEEIEAEVENLDGEERRLEAIESNYETYRDLRDVEADIEDKDADLDDIDSFPIDRLEHARSVSNEYEDAQATRDDAKHEFRVEVDVDDPSSYRERLLDHSETIETYHAELSGWRTRVESLRSEGSELSTRRAELQDRVSDLHPEWETLDDVREQHVDTFSKATVRSVVDKVQELRKGVTNLEDEADRLETRHGELGDRIENATASTETSPLRSALPTAVGGVIAAAVLGGGIAIGVNALAGVIATIVILVGTGVYAARSVQSEAPTDGGIAIDSLRATKEEVQSELTSMRKALESKRGELDDAIDELDAIKDEYALPKDAELEAITTFYDSFVSLHGDISEYDRDLDTHEAERAALEETLEEVRVTLEEIGAIDDDDPATLETADTVFVATERVYTHLDAAQTLDSATQALVVVEADIVDILSAGAETSDAEVGDDDLASRLADFITYGDHVAEARERLEERDRLRKTLHQNLGVKSVASALEPYRPSADDEDGEGQTDMWVIDALDRVHTEYGGRDEVGSRLEIIEDEKDTLGTEIEEKRDERADLDQTLESLKSDKDVQAAHETIEKGQRELEPRLEAYAANRIAERLLDDLHEDYIERTTGPLLDTASEIFERITGGDYTQVESFDEFDDLDFAAILKDGREQRTSELSRATAEQLFLSVRLARIQHADKPLPVMLDDSLTNFDAEHLGRTLDVVSNLAADTQVFLLTCHPSLVDLVVEGYEATHWGLEVGQFDGPHERANRSKELLEGGSASESTITE